MKLPPLEVLESRDFEYIILWILLKNLKNRMVRTFFYLRYYSYHIMGMFDTLIFPRPVKCNACGKEQVNTQTDRFENLLRHYEVGDLLPGSFITGIIEETFFCKHESLNDEERPPSTQSVFLAMWNSIFIDITATYEEADRKVKNFGTSDLYLLYKNLHKKRNHFRAKCNKVINWCKEYSKYILLTFEEREKYKKKPFSALSHSSVLKYVEKESPLKEFIQDIEAQGDLSGLFL